MPIRTAIIIKDTVPVNVIVLPKGEDGDSALAEFDGTTIVYDPSGDEYNEVEGCLIVEATDDGRDIGVGNGWLYVDGEWVDTRPPEEPLG